MSRLTDLQRELETALRNAKAADTMSRYDIAVFWEDRAFELSEGIEKLKEEDNDGLSKPI